MNKKLILIIAILVLIGMVGGGFMVSKNFLKTSSNTPNNETESVNAQNSLKDLIAKNIPQTCEYTSEEGSGTIYVNGGKVRGDFELTIEGQKSKSHMIFDGNTSYIWSDGQQTGIKMTINQEDLNQVKESSTPENFDPEQKFNYNCRPWGADNTFFKLPEGVIFSDFNIPTIPLPTGSASSASGNSAKCAACNNLPEEAKVQCLSALKCN